MPPSVLPITAPITAPISGAKGTSVVRLTPISAARPATAPMPASSHRFMCPIRSVALKVLYFHRLRGVGRVEAEDPRVEVKFSAQRLLDGLRAAEAVLLAFERQVSDRDALLPQRFHDDLRLVRRHHLILKALKHDHRRFEPVHVVN